MTIEISGPVLHVAPSPHLSDVRLTTRQMMLDVLIALTPAMLAAIYLFHGYAVKQMAVCIGACLITEAICARLRKRPMPLGDLSAVVTGLILALSLPATAPVYVGVIASAVAIGIGKMAFGGLGMNIFNPAMVGRAFVMIAFASALGAAGYQDAMSTVDAISQATPMDAYKQNGIVASLGALFWGATNGSLGETSALACLLGGLYLCIRRTVSWQIPAGVIGAVAVIGGAANLMNMSSQWTVTHHLLGGSLLFGAFFIATDPVTSPLTPWGKFVFGAIVGILIMALRFFSGYPEGVMFAVLMGNALTPLINRWCIPQPFGGRGQTKIAGGKG